MTIPYSKRSRIKTIQDVEKLYDFWVRDLCLDLDAGVDLDGELAGAAEAGTITKSEAAILRRLVRECPQVCNDYCEDIYDLMFEAKLREREEERGRLFGGAG